MDQGSGVQGPGSRIHGSEVEVQALSPISVRNPQPQTPNPKPETRNLNEIGVGDPVGGRWRGRSCAVFEIPSRRLRGTNQGLMTLGCRVWIVGME